MTGSRVRESTARGARAAAGLVCLVSTLSSGPGARAQSGGPYSVVQGTVAVGGGSSSSGPYSLAGTVEVGVAGTSMSGSGFCLDGGNWSGLLPAGGCAGFYAVKPCRVYDSRITGGVLVSGSTRVIPVVATACGLPPWAHAVAINLTAVTGSGAGVLTVFPASVAAPSANSTLPFRVGQTRANNVVMRLGLGGELAALASVSGPPGGTVHVVVDVTGYFVGGGI